MKSKKFVQKLLFIFLSVSFWSRSDSKKIWLKSKANGEYITLSSSFLTTSKNFNDKYPETFELIENDDKTISVYSLSNDCFISVDPITNKLMINEKLPIQFRKFEIFSNTDDSVSFKFKLNSKFVSIDNLGDFSLLANGLNNELWESFLKEEIKEASTPETQVTTRTPTTSDISSNDAHEGFFPSFNEFSSALTLNQYSRPSKEQFENFKRGAINQGGIQSKIELAMFLTHVLVQSNGLTVRLEAQCGSGCVRCPSTYSFPSDLSGKLYCGRGYFQLTWSYNYKIASQDLFNSDTLVTNPDQVETDDKMAWAVAFWVWKSKVRKNQNVINNHQFGTSTSILKRAECKVTNNEAARSRFAKYIIVLKAFKIAEMPKEEGCYETSQDSSIEKPSFSEFSNALTFNKYPVPTKEQYDNFVNGASSQGGISSKRELAMFLAQIIHESGGLVYKVEQRCASGCANCHWDYSDPKNDYPGRHYCGRGYIQLSWYYNYKESSRQLFKDDRLYKNPDLVETDDKISWAVSFWFWKQNVRINKKVRNGQFGASTKQINGGLECNGANTQLAKIRFEKYKLTLKAFNIKEDPVESGCY